MFRAMKILLLLLVSAIFWLGSTGAQHLIADLDGANGANIVDFALSAEDGGLKTNTLVINEFMASNSSYIQDPQGHYDDWIEIYNYGTSAVNIGRMYLTDNLSVPTRWRIPDGNPAATTILPQGYLLIWADNDTTDSGLHANFKISTVGEEIGLFDTDGSTLIDSVAFGDQTNDISYGRYPDANDNWRFFGFPSPGRQNIDAYLGEVADTKFSQDRGFYDTPFSITITTETEDAVIYYTLDGTEPYELTGRALRGVVYTTPIPISETTCLRAIAIKPGWKPTNVDAQTYIFLDDVVRQDRRATLAAGFPSSWGGTSPDYGMDPDVIGQNGEDLFNGIYAATIRDDLKSIPTLSIVMDIDDMFGPEGIYTNSTRQGIDWERPASVELIYPDGSEGFQVNCGIRIHGGYFRQHNATKKHSLRLLFKGIYGPTKLQFPL
ncbi:MAG: chitobiase/beta-hexosaminidase C-terminal domain-containing protein, partial [Phycisphaerae bacterium]